MSFTPISPLYSPSATATAGSTTIVVNGGINCTSVRRGSLVHIDGQIARATSGTLPDLDGISQIELMEEWPHNTVTAPMIAFMIYEGLADIVGKLHDILANKEDDKQYEHIDVTVGPGGQFATINEAVRHLTLKRPIYTQQTVTANIWLKAGFVMAEQLLIQGLDLGWITIFSELGDYGEVMVDPTALTRNFMQPIYGAIARPMIGIAQGGTGPRIGCVFNMDNGDGDGGQRRYGLMAAGPGSSAHVMNFRGFKNCGSRAIYANRGAVINAYGADVSGAFEYGVYANRGRVNCHNIKANNCGQYGAIALYGGHIEAFAGECNHAGTHGIYAGHGSHIGFNQGKANNAGQFGIYAFSTSTIDAPSAEANNAGTRGVYAQDVGKINFKSGFAQNAGQRGIFGINQSEINAENANAEGAGDFGVIASSGSRINFNNGKARRILGENTTQDIAVTGGSEINAVGAEGGTNVTVRTISIGGIIYRL